MRYHEHRRHFFHSLTAGTVLTLAASQAHAQDEPAKQDDAADPFDAEVEARMALILARHGEKLDLAAREAVREDVRSLVRRGARLKEFALDNGDGPALLFRPYRGPADEPPRVLPA
jgi:hypothetical protein